MLFKRLLFTPSIVFHYTKRNNVESIMRDRTIKRFKDVYTFFSNSESDSDFLLENLACNPKAGVRDYKGIIRDNINKKEDFVLLKILVNKNYTDSTKWYQSDSTEGTAEDLVKEINAKTICFKGDLRCSKIEIVKEYEWV